MIYNSIIINLKYSNPIIIEDDKDSKVISFIQLLDLYEIEILDFKKVGTKYRGRIKISPQAAILLLKNNSNPLNRHINELHKNNLSKMMSLWEDNSESIVFNSDAIIKDGHHRLEAIAKQTHTIEIDIAYGVESNLFDNNIKRSLKNHLDMIDKKVLGKYSAYVSILIYLKERGANFSGKPPLDEQIKIALDYESEIALFMTSKINKKDHKPITSALIWTSKKHHTSLEFLKKVCDKNYIIKNEKDPVHQLQKYLAWFFKKYKTLSPGQSSLSQEMALKALYAFYHYKNELEFNNFPNNAKLKAIYQKLK